MEQTKLVHLLHGRRLSPHTETLIIGTFNPRHPENKIDFFYGRGRNYLWRLLPYSLGEAIDLKGASLEAKQAFMARHKVDFIDLISSATVRQGWKINYSDRDLDRNCTLG